MPWYDIAFFVSLGVSLGMVVIRLARVSLTESQRANRDETAKRNRRAKLLTYSPGEWVWVIGSSLAYLAICLAFFPDKAVLALAGITALLAITLI